MVIIEDKNGKFVDAEACGGLHVTGMEQAIGLVKIIGTERISDGVDRIELVAGNAALDYFRKVNGSLSQAALKLNSDPFKLNEKISSLDDENRKMRKEISELNESVAQQTASTLSSSDKIDKELDMPRAMLRSIATKVVAINGSAVVLLRNKAGELVCISGEKSKVNALDFIKEKAGSRKFVGGGSPKFAEGKIV
jgi:alanyl-tRNA synthetase